MSKGPGNQQRRILAELEKRPAFYVAELYQGKTRSEAVSLLRAANKLHAAGKVNMWDYRFAWPRVVVARPGYEHTDTKGRLPFGERWNYTPEQREENERRARVALAMSKC